jgi:hypothetical protein
MERDEAKNVAEDLGPYLERMGISTFARALESPSVSASKSRTEYLLDCLYLGNSVFLFDSQYLICEAF